MRRAAVVFSLSWTLTGCGGITLQDIVTPQPVPEDACLVVGFLGGRDHWDDADKGVRKLALSLRKPDYRVFAETFENQRRKVAESFVVAASPARLVVYGQSFGGAAVPKFARTLDALGVPILLTIQIDSVGRDDALVPRNVAYAVNLYQSDGWFIRGEQPIRAVDPDATTILGNWRFRYNEPPGSEISLEDVPIWKRLFRIPHARMDRDAAVWRTVERLIRAACGRENLRRVAEVLGS
ncbi:MAG: hypothetical protein E2P02_08910 [Acidobacteria bacterium]|nr:MAG: hypothetical protein E2P02_08910 [Acidobacteriota bacterium]